MQERERLVATGMVLLLLALFGLATLVFHALARSASGRAMLAVRSSDVAARTVGISPAKQKVVIFALSAAIAGFGGVLYGVVNFSISRSTVRRSRVLELTHC